MVKPMSCGKEKIFMIREKCPITQYMMAHEQRMKNLMDRVLRGYTTGNGPTYNEKRISLKPYTKSSTSQNPISRLSQTKYDLAPVSSSTYTRSTTDLETTTDTDSKLNELERMIKEAKEDKKWTQSTQYHTQDQ